MSETRKHPDYNVELSAELLQMLFAEHDQRFSVHYEFPDDIFAKLQEELIPLLGTVNATMTKVACPLFARLAIPETLLFTGMEGCGIVGAEGILRRGIKLNFIHRTLRWRCEDEQVRFVGWNRVYSPQLKRFVKVETKQGKGIYSKKDFQPLLDFFPTPVFPGGT